MPSRPTPLLLCLTLPLVLTTLACAERTGSRPKPEPPLPALESGPPSAPAPQPLPERATCAGLTLGAGSHDGTLTHAGLTRHYRLHVPPGYDPARPTPVVLSFHGYSASGQEQEALSQLSQEADARGFLAVYPQAVEASQLPGDSAGAGERPGWNAGICCGTGQRARVDDVGFVDALLAHLDTRVCLDTKRIYATGFSNGGFLSYRLACERAGQFAAIAPVAGSEGYGPCAPSRPVPVMHFHGTEDFTIHYEGGTHPLLSGSFPSAYAAVEHWAEHNGCTAASATTFQQGDSTCDTRTVCTQGATVTLCTTRGGGHTWPGGFVSPELGRTTRDLDATREMWRFFAAHPRP